MAVWWSKARSRARHHSVAATWAIVFAAGVAAISPVPGHASAIRDTALNEQVVMIPARSGNEHVELETTIYRPPGEGPFPLMVMNHGKALGNPRDQGRDRFIILAREFVRRGYAVVVPMRKGFSRSTGEYVSNGCNMAAHGLSQANDLEGALEYLRTQSWVDPERILVAGQSYGGLAAVAFSIRNFPGVRGIINFAGGLKVHGGDCQWQDSLVQAFSRFGAQSTSPTLWFYGENDAHFGPKLAERMHQAYVQAGGHAVLVAYGPFKKDAHSMAASRDGVQVWWPQTEQFLRAIGMPADTVVALNDELRIPDTEYAALDDAEAVPYLSSSARQQYRAFLAKSTPRAFAISASGAWSWAEEGDDPMELALFNCQKGSSQPCKLYAVDNHVVWEQAPPVLADAPMPAAATAGQ